jgi:hypothetical protein
MHGSASNGHHTVFGCEDGVLVIEKDGDNYTASKIDNPADMPADATIGTVMAHPERETLIGLARPNLMFEIDAEAGTVTSIPWSGVVRVASAFDSTGQMLMAMDESGQVHVLDGSQGWALKAALPAATGVPDSGSSPTIEAHAHEGFAYISDPIGQRIVIVDTAAASIAGQISLDFAPGQIRWLGLPEHDHGDDDHDHGHEDEHDHEHEDEHDHEHE